ncbi:HAMP domain-containing protein [Hydrogenimonas urashimensis]|uniref:HAMP domain-containing protein n=1 Tax=Hydrogenimonas urashimensis TaxID=2740515 RepID=UPI001916BC34|nr:methyl-accepting chemotaxis protein [Hydrogenimonas urashimensis]
MRQIILLAFGVIILMSLFAYGFAFKGFSDAAKSAEAIKHTDTLVSRITTLEKNLLESVHLIDNYVITGNDTYFRQYHTKKDAIEKRIKSLKKTTEDKILRKQLDLLQDEIVQYFQIVERIKHDSATIAEEITEKIMLTLDEMHNHVLKLQKKTIEEANSKIFAMKSMILLVAGGSIALAVFLALYISRFISKNLQTVQDAAHDLASSDGDLTKRIPVIGNNEIGQMAKQVNLFIEKVQRTIKESKENGSENASVAAELSATALESRKARRGRSVFDRRYIQNRRECVQRSQKYGRYRQ